MDSIDTMQGADASLLTKNTQIVFDAVVKRFPTGTTALDGIDLAVRRGEFVAVVGPSGCGKSTLLRMAAGLECGTDGSVSLGTDSVGFIFQEPTLLPWRDVLGNVELSAELGHLDSRTRRHRAVAAIDSVGLGGFANQLPSALSGGMKMRVSLARALTLLPDVLLLDEPFGALDEMTRHDMQSLLYTLCTEGEFTAMFITHSVAEAVFLADRVVVMTPRPGKIHSIVDIAFDGPRTESLRFDSRFTDYAARISSILRGVA
ncbi:ABC transporter ATP-binding protein [Rhodococcus sp. G-MC3]|uniref:ABC transporter ATP-binding protein n=1 Tax=Rhodococcus sp. G-MC3 TaxID=3046209 RepID=UPI0024BA43E2|nr:ABC transporter ATP-binding protein [Rhodococcus sp. G-MC3]MDJ0392943.1 ABC transporter ATP-binding protein [Rhodococcus sp. G-MC3]